MTLRIASASDFANEEVVQLPSQTGTENGVKLRRVGVHRLVNGKGVPGGLMSLLTNATVNTDDPKQIAEGLEAMAYVASKVMIEPRLTMSDKPKANEVSVDVLGVDDLTFIFQWALGNKDAVESVNRFPTESNGGVPVTPDEQGIQPETVNNDGNT